MPSTPLQCLASRSRKRKQKQFPLPLSRCATSDNPHLCLCFMDFNFPQTSKITNPLTVFCSSHLSCGPQPCPFDGRPQSYPGTQAKPSSPETPSSQTPPHENQDLEQPGTPVPTEDPDAMETSESSCIEIGHSLTESHMKECARFKMPYFVF